MSVSLRCLLPKPLTIASSNRRCHAFVVLDQLLFGSLFSTLSRDKHPYYLSTHSSSVMEEIDSALPKRSDIYKYEQKLMMVGLAHPWPEWIGLMSIMMQQNYFDHMRRNEDLLVQELGLNCITPHLGFHPAGELGEKFSDPKSVLKACLSFGNDRFDILRSLSRRGILALVVHGCPNFDKMVLLSSKLLRKYVNLEEGDICSNCAVRNSCDKAFLVPNYPKEATTADVMRVLLQYANGTVTNEGLKRKPIDAVVRKLICQIAKLGSIPIDPNLPRPIVRTTRKKKQPPPLTKRSRRQGDWFCSKCGYVNFSKNLICLQCDAKPKAREVAPREWKCSRCNRMNDDRSNLCFHCESRRVGDEDTHQITERNTENEMNQVGIPKLWNFIFEDDESDGADVAAFEYADSAEADREVYDTETKSYPQNLGFDDFGDWNEPEKSEQNPKSSEIPIRPDSEAITGKSNHLLKRSGKRGRKKGNFRNWDDDTEDERNLKGSHVFDTKRRTRNYVAKRTHAFSDTEDEFYNM